ncbi:cell division protein FtsL [Lacticaseibacillus pabuli]|uniref:Cell division protein FtsL n=1 Tax=Lacticaseibacillus pabuli TaxID=3025672 RepID=A0ABY7WNH1_9LACO|nr:cell division protein FtsL [Lacticaseibacillus sp. KACC 23028]WDF81676.1 cell division protein FtsL [Lacticaseibacillus sp. KACC 23028]
MMDNAARVLQSNPETTATPIRKTSTQTQAVPVHNTRVHVSPFEKLCICSLTIVTMAIAVACVMVQSRITQTTRAYQMTQIKTSQVNHGITNLEQAVSELSDSQRLSAFAKAHGLTVVEGSVKQAVK